MKRANEAELAYRRAFQEFSNKAQQVQVLTAHSDAEPRQLEIALLELEKAHVAYISSRDRWVQYLLPAAPPIALPAHRQHQSHEDCVKAIAELLWEGAGRPEGADAENWRKAEEIVKEASAAAA